MRDFFGTPLEPGDHVALINAVPGGLARGSIHGEPLLLFQPADPSQLVRQEENPPNGAFLVDVVVRPCYKHGMDNAQQGAAQMEQKLYTLAGVSRDAKGQLTHRFASGSAQRRAAVLRRAGHTETQFWDLPNAMTVDEAREWLVGQGFFALMPTGQRRGVNGGSVRQVPRRAAQHDAHVKTWEAARADFVARMAAGRAAAKARKQAEREAAERQAA